jgi:hypothetical protein
MVFVRLAYCLCAVYMLALGLVLERARAGPSRKGYAARWRLLTTPPAC